jgi:hypothetical protein
LVQRAKDFSFNCKIFRHSFDDNECVRQCVQFSRGLDSAEDSALLFCAQPLFINIALQALVDGLQTACEELFRDVAYDDVESCACGYLSNAVAHRACADYAEDFAHI